MMLPTRLLPVAVALALEIVASASAAAAASGAARADLVFATYAGDFAQARKAEAMVSSLRAFGGRFARAPVYVVVDDPAQVPEGGLRGAGIELLPLEADPRARDIPFFRKVWAAAQVEARLAGRARVIAWLDPETLVLRPPTALAPVGGEVVAIRPVFLANRVGLPPHQPLDGFWTAVLRVAGLDPG